MTYKFKERIEGYYHYIYELSVEQHLKLQQYILNNGLDADNPNDLFEAIKAFKDEPTFEGTEITASSDFEINKNTVIFDAGIW